MITLEQTSGNAYTKDADYAAFSGRLVQTFTTTYYDPKEKVFIKRTVEYIDVGRADRVLPVDAEAAMEPEPWEHENGAEAARQANIRRGKEREASMQMDVMAYLRRFGPAHCRMMCRDLELPYTTLNEHLRRFEHRSYFRAGKVSGSTLWGLIGVHDRDSA